MSRHAGLLVKKCLLISGELLPALVVRHKFYVKKRLVYDNATVHRLPVWTTIVNNTFYHIHTSSFWYCVSIGYRLCVDIASASINIYTYKCSHVIGVSSISIYPKFNNRWHRDNNQVFICTFRYQYVYKMMLTIFTFYVSWIPLPLQSKSVDKDVLNSDWLY